MFKAHMKRSQQGLTLLEVLVALVILAVAMTAIIKATGENIRSTGYLQEKTMAVWVGSNALNKARLNFMQLPEEPEHRDYRERVLSQDWEWQGNIKKSSNGRIQEIHIKVYHLPDQRLITELIGFTYEK